MWKFLRSAFLAVFLCVTAAGLWCGYEAYTFLNVPPETPGQDVSFDVTPGMTISRALKAKNVITDPFKFRLLARYREAGGRMKAGRFLLNTGWTPDQVLNELISGKPVLTRVTIPEGLTWWQTAAILGQAGRRLRRRHPRSRISPPLRHPLRHGRGLSHARHLPHQDAS